MNEKTALVQMLDDSRGRLRSRIAGLDTRLEIYPGWRIKEIIDHLTAWDEVVVSTLHAIAAGAEAPTPALDGIDAYNAKAVEQRKAISYEQSLLDWDNARQALINSIMEFPDELIGVSFTTPWGEPGTIRQIVEIWVEHEDYHSQEIGMFRAKRRFPLTR